MLCRLRLLDLRLNEVFQFSCHLFIEAVLYTELSDYVRDVLGIINHKSSCLLIGLTNLDVGNEKRLYFTDINRLIKFFLRTTFCRLII